VGPDGLGPAGLPPPHDWRMASPTIGAIVTTHERMRRRPGRGTINSSLCRDGKGFSNIEGWATARSAGTSSIN